MPDENSQGFLAITNIASAPVKVHLTFDSYNRDITLSSRETRLLKLREQLEQTNSPERGASRALLITLKQDGGPGDIIATGFVFNLHNGYSSGFTMVDPATNRSTELAGAGVRFGYADVTEGFPVGTRFKAPLILANVGSKPLTATISADFTIADTPTSLGISQQEIMPGELKIVQLTEELLRLGISGPVEASGIDIAYHGAPPGSLIAHLTSVDQSGDFSFEVPIKDPSEMAHRPSNSYPWTVEDGADTIVYLKNTTEHHVRGAIQSQFAGGDYNPDRIDLGPYQTVALDVDKLKHSGVRDVRKQLFAASATHGKLDWVEASVGPMIGRAEIVNVAQGTGEASVAGIIVIAKPVPRMVFSLPHFLVGLLGESDSLTLQKIT